jgi:hypothetical protein
MKPLNLDNRPCSPISSNCVIWQGPDIPCIKLCTGDTVSDVIFKLATELCTIMDQLKVSNYDLSCLNLTACPPEDFQALIQLLIEKICELNGITPDEGKSAGCPDCVVSVAPCLVQNGQTTMQLVDYVQMIANRLCSIISEIDSINDQISTINSTLVDLQYQIDNLPTYTLPKIAMDCILSGDQPLDAVVAALVNNDTLGYCALINATGTPVEINTAVLSQCISDGDQPLSALPAVNTFSAYYSGSWVNAVALGTDPSVSNAIKNIWVAVCDMYNYLSNIEGITVQDTTTVNLTYTAGTLTAAVQDTGWVYLDGFNYIPISNVQGKPQVRRIGNILYFRGTVIVPLDDGGTPRVWNYSFGPNTDSYYNETSVAPFTGAGGVTITGNGGIIFNNDASVIPLSVLPTGYAIDNSYQNASGWKIATRTVNATACSTILTTLFSQVITTTGKLVLGLVQDAEEGILNSSSNAHDTSHLNYIISHVVEDEFLPQFKTGSNIVHSKAAPAGAANLNLDFPIGTYPFSCNANDENQIGGFSLRLDGLTAFISPCVTPAIPTPTPCIPA